MRCVPKDEVTGLKKDIAEYRPIITLADAILDRLVHNAHKIALTGDSMRKKKSILNKPKDNG